MRTILHVGQSKAGSTALQECFDSSQEVLLENGVLYPSNVPGVDINNHRLLSQPILDYSRLTSDVRRIADGPEQLAALYSDFKTNVRDQIVQSKPNCLLLSYENLFGKATRMQKSRLPEELDGLGVGAVEVVVYIRRPSARYLSRVQQGLKARGSLVRPNKPAYRSRMSCLAEMFGQSSISARLFERQYLSNGDIIHDFCEHFLSAEGVDAERLNRPKRTNDSVSAASLLLLDRFRRDTAAGKNMGFTLREFRLALHRAERNLPLSKPRLKSEFAEMTDYSSDEPLWLRDELGLEFADFDYARLEAGQFASLRKIGTFEELIEPGDAQEEVSVLAQELVSKVRSEALVDWVAKTTGTRYRRTLRSRWNSLRLSLGDRSRQQPPQP